MRPIALALLATALTLGACAAPGTPAPAAPARSAAAPASLVVHDGDTVEASGLVQVLPGHTPRFCAPAPVVAVGTIGGDLAPCDQGVDLEGLDSTRLEPQGQALLRGTLHGGVLHVSAQGPPRPEPAEPFDWQVPCPAPPGGWQRGERPDSNGLHELMYDEHPGWFRELRVAYPDGRPGGGTDGPAPRTVFVVEIVAADHVTAERLVRQRYAGNVCIVVDTGAKSLADQRRDLEKVQAIADPLLQDRASGVYSLRGGDQVRLDMVMLTPQLDEKFAPVRGLIAANPWLRPVA